MTADPPQGWQRTGGRIHTADGARTIALCSGEENAATAQLIVDAVRLLSQLDKIFHTRPASHEEGRYIGWLRERLEQTDR